MKRTNDIIIYPVGYFRKHTPQNIRDAAAQIKINIKWENMLMLLDLFIPSMNTCTHMYMFILCIQMENLIWSTKHGYSMTTWYIYYKRIKNVPFKRISF